MEISVRFDQGELRNYIGTMLFEQIQLLRRERTSRINARAERWAIEDAAVRAVALLGLDDVQQNFEGTIGSLVNNKRWIWRKTKQPAWPDAGYRMAGILADLVMGFEVDRLLRGDPLLGDLKYIFEGGIA